MSQNQTPMTVYFSANHSLAPTVFCQAQFFFGKRTVQVIV